MGSRKAVAISLLMAASALAAPQVASAKTVSAASAREAALVERLERLEVEVAQLRGDLGVARSGQAEAAASAQAAAQATQLAQSAATRARLGTGVGWITSASVFCPVSSA